MLKVACVRTAAAAVARPAARHVSSSANPFPFPANANATPHQIFHLPPSATRDEVKARYYDLVRIYHPDSPISRAVPPETAHARFQAISAAYAALSGKARRMGDAEDGGPAGGGGGRPDFHSLSTAMWRARQRRRAELDVGWDDRWKDGLMFGAVVLTVGAFVWQTFSARRQAMGDVEWSRHFSKSSQSSSPTRSGRPSDRSDEALLSAEPALEGPTRK
ncbi:hypothetical protein WOLCODRAFT_138653 [Wolfiporia cocos MD-104 SS10]|uniref:J domain-containing protein n=1 Tax=Wolfiporia cocos (strain MD-104) TaxID=742152 RepID=A0A2H3JNX8_WOLCO|nr:hypothetical protein WOLCODRAFT_138653 [Wolfiporia cocos MD-104 SS10]